MAASPPDTASPPDLDALRARIHRMERGPAAADAPAISLGLAALDRALPWGGLPRGAVHEIMPPDPGDGAATAFLAVLAGRLAGGSNDPGNPQGSDPEGDSAEGGGPILWVSGRGDLFPPGAAHYGWRPERMLCVATRSAADTLWAMEDGLRCAALAAVAGDVGALDFAVTRRLQLAAAESGVPLLLHRPWQRRLTPSAALTRWRVRPVPSAPSSGPSPLPAARGESRDALSFQDAVPDRAQLPDPLWRLDLLRCRGGRPQTWTVAWDRAAGALRLADSPETAAEAA